MIRSRPCHVGHIQVLPLRAAHIYIISQHIRVVLSLGVARIEVRVYVCVH